jgi:hypothetical protein
MRIEQKTTPASSSPVTISDTHANRSSTHDIAGADGNTMNPRDHVDQQVSHVDPNDIDRLGGVTVST